MLHQPDHDRHRILHVEKIPLLAAVGVFRPIGAEEFESARLLDLPVGLAHHRAHLALVVFIGTEHIEELQAGQGVEHPFPAGPEVEKMLGVAVHIERLQPVEPGRIIVETGRSVAVRGGRGGDHEPCPLGQGIAGHGPGVGEIVAHQVFGVGLGGGGTSPQMHDGLHISKRLLLPAYRRQKGILVQVVDKAAVDQILPFFAAAKIVHHQNVVPPGRIEAPQQGAAQKSGSAGHDEHSRLPCQAFPNCSQLAVTSG